MSASRFFIFLLAFSFSQVPSLSDPPLHPKDVPKIEFNSFKFNALTHQVVENSDVASMLLRPPNISPNSATTLPSPPSSIPWPKRVTLSYHHTTDNCQRWWDDYTQFGVLLAPQYRYGHILPMINLQVERMDPHRYGANVGVAGRYISSRARRIVGLNLFYDFQEGHRGHYHQAGAGFEWLSKRWDGRVNLYIPFTDKHSRRCLFDNYIGDFRATRTCSTHSLYGVSGEAGYLAVKSKDFLLYVAAGPYYLNSPSVTQGWGVRLHIRPQFRDYLALDLSMSSDRIFKTVFQSAIILYLPLYQISSRRGLTERQIYQPIERFNVSPLFKRCCWQTNW